MIIRSIRHKGLKRLVEDNDHRGIQTNLVNRVRNVLATLLLSNDMNELMQAAPPGWRVHKLSGKRKETWSISTSGNWRITFEEEEGYLDLLDLEDYH